MRINKKIGITFIVVIVVVNLISLSLMNILNHKSFNKYAEKENIQFENEIVELIEKLDVDSLDKLYIFLEKYAIDKNVKILIAYNDDIIISVGKLKHMHMHQSMKAQTEQEKFYVNINNAKLYVQIDYDRRYMIEQSQKKFGNQLNIAHILSFIISIIIAIIATVIVSRQFSKPIQLLNQNLRYISNGNYDKYLDINSKIYELDQLNISSKLISKSIKDQDKIREDLVNNLSHDLRTPLTVVKTNIEAMNDGIIEINNENLQTLNDGINHIIAIANRLDELTKIKEEISDLESINISKETISIVKFFNQEALKHEITIGYNVDENIFMKIKTESYCQIVQNLISNAIKYNKESGEIFVSLFKKGHTIELVVKDNGIGIKNEDIQFIFDRFYCCDKSRKHGEESSGIGLSIVKSLVNFYNGEIIVNSVYGEGSEFKVIFTERKEK